jgi:hypothetical protein
VNGIGTDTCEPEERTCGILDTIAAPGAARGAASLHESEALDI